MKSSTPCNASLEHPLCSIKSTSKSNNVTPNITLLDPVFVNPASKSSLRVVLDKIAVDAGINTRSRHFVYVVCDGSPMTLLWQLIMEEPQNYSWVIPITGLGHEEMNMVKSFTEMVFDFILSEFFETQGYSTPKSLAFAKRCSDYHIAFDNLLKFRESVWMEMVYAFRISNQNKVEQNFESSCKWTDESGE